MTGREAVMNGPIQSLLRERVELRDHLPVSGWVHEREQRVIGPSSPCLSPGDSVDIVALRQELEAVPPRASLCVMLGADPSASILKLLLDAARQERVIYVLSPTGFGEGTRDPGLRDLGRSRVLVRRMKSVPATVLLVGRGERGILWLGPPKAPNAWVLRASPAQGVALFTVFLHLFWHHASDEAFTTGKNLEFRPAKARPFDVPLPSDAPVMLHSAATSLPWSGASAAAGPVTIQLGDGLRTLLTTPTTERHIELGKRVSGGCAVVSNDLDLPAFVLGSAQRKVSTGSGDWSLHVQLDDEQTTILDSLVQSVTSSPCWRFHAGSPMSSVASAPVWLASEKAALVPSKVQEIDVGRVPAAELRLVSSTEPASFPPAHPLSLSARYRWIVDPPRLPAGAAEDKLVSAWSELDRVVEERTKRVRAQIDEAEKHGESVVARLARIASDMLGFKRGRDERRSELQKLLEKKPSTAGPDEARGIVERLRALETSVAQIAEDQRDAERRELEKLHIEEQQRKWEADLAKKKADLADRKSALKEAREKEDRLKLAQREDKDAHQKEKDPAAKKDVEARMLRAKDELERARKEVQSLEASVVTIENDLQRPFKPKPLERKDALQLQPASGKGARFVPQSTPGDPASVPAQALPATGHLRAVKNQRYLVIERWEELAAGESDAQRLSAKLVAPQEGQ